MLGFFLTEFGLISSDLSFQGLGLGSLAPIGTVSYLSFLRDCSQGCVYFFSYIGSTCSNAVHDFVFFPFVGSGQNLMKLARVIQYQELASIRPHNRSQATPLRSPEILNPKSRVMPPEALQLHLAGCSCCPAPGVDGCAHFTFWPDVGCLLSGAESILQPAPMKSPREQLRKRLKALYTVRFPTASIRIVAIEFQGTLQRSQGPSTVKMRLKKQRR